MSLSANAGAYRSKPIFASHSAIGCTVVITRGFGSEKARRDAILYYTEVPIFSRSASVKCGSTETSMSLSANAGAYRSKPIFASHSAIGCTVVITRGFGSEKAR